jgi:hypothetical protein
MSSIAASAVNIQTSTQSVPSTPSWFGEVALIARHRFGHYDVIDFVAVLIGYAISGERTLEAFYERLQPFAPAFMALFGRDRLPHRSTLSRVLDVGRVTNDLACGSMPHARRNPSASGLPRGDLLST